MYPSLSVVYNQSMMNRLLEANSKMEQNKGKRVPKRPALTTLNSKLSRDHPLSKENIWRMDAVPTNSSTSTANFLIFVDGKTEFKSGTSNCDASRPKTVSTSILRSEKENQLFQIKKEYWSNCSKQQWLAGDFCNKKSPKRKNESPTLAASFNLLQCKTVEKNIQVEKAAELELTPSSRPLDNADFKIFENESNGQEPPRNVTDYRCTNSSNAGKENQAATYVWNDDEEDIEQVDPEKIYKDRPFEAEEDIFRQKTTWYIQEPFALAKYYEEMELKWTAPYREDVYKHLKELEVKHRILVKYFYMQEEVTPDMRTVLVDWMIEISDCLRFEPETVHMAVNYVDRFLSIAAVPKPMFQLLGTAALFVASKQQEIHPPEVTEFVYFTDETYTKAEVLAMEQVLLKRLDFILNPPTAVHFADIFSSMARATKNMTLLAHYLCEIAILDEGSMGFLPSQIGAAAISLAGSLLVGRWWSEDMERLTGYKYEDLKDVGHWLFNQYRLIPVQPCQAVRVKYSKPRFEKIAEEICQLEAFDSFAVWK